MLEATLDSPGLVILSDVYYPGWELTIDDKPATIYRVNGMMRGASVPAGTHRLVYTYAPRSFRVGGVISIMGMAALAILGLVCVLRPVDRVLGGSNEVDPQHSSCPSGSARTIKDIFMKKITLLAAVLVVGPLLGLHAQTPKQPKVAPGPDEPDWEVVLRERVRALDVC